MRAVMGIIGLVLLARLGLCQDRPYLRMPPVLPDTARQIAALGEAAEDADTGFLHDYYLGVSYYDRGLYEQAERAFRRAFSREPNEDAARYIYYALLYQGQDLQAAAFKERHSTYTFALPPVRKGLEGVYAEAGVRFSARPASAGNIVYSDGGAYLRLSATTRLWQSFAYLHQNDNLGHFRQFEYHASLVRYLRHGWTVLPSLDICYVPYTTQYTAVDSVFYSSAYKDGHDSLIYRTRAERTTQFNAPGKAGFISLSLPVSRHTGAFDIGLDPAVHYWPGKGHIDYQYASAGITDSFEDSHYRGSKAFHETGSSSRDTSATHFFFQLGGSVTWRPPIKGAPLTLRAAGYYLQNNGNVQAFAWEVFAMLWWHPDYRVFLSCLSKGDLPLALPAAGRYLNFEDPVNVRTSISFQWHPLRHWSPMLTYQYEHNTRLEDGATLIYHSAYLTLKYNL